MNHDELKKRSMKFIQELSIPVTAFCRHIELSPQAFYMWQRNELSLKDSTVLRIKSYIEKYNF